MNPSHSVLRLLMSIGPEEESSLPIRESVQRGELEGLLRSEMRQLASSVVYHSILHLPTTNGKTDARKKLAAHQEPIDTITQRLVGEVVGFFQPTTADFSASIDFFQKYGGELWKKPVEQEIKDSATQVWAYLHSNSTPYWKLVNGGKPTSPQQKVPDFVMVRTPKTRPHLDSITGALDEMGLESVWVANGSEQVTLVPSHSSSITSHRYVHPGAKRKNTEGSNDSPYFNTPQFEKLKHQKSRILSLARDYAPYLQSEKYPEEIAKVDEDAAKFVRHIWRLSPQKRNRALVHSLVEEGAPSLPLHKLVELSNFSLPSMDVHERVNSWQDAANPIQNYLKQKIQRNTPLAISYFEANGHQNTRRLDKAFTLWPYDFSISEVRGSIVVSANDYKVKFWLEKNKPTINVTFNPSSNSKEYIALASTTEGYSIRARIISQADPLSSSISVIPPLLIEPANQQASRPPYYRHPQPRIAG